MCIIASSEIGKELPTNETIKTMWYKNPDGAGFMFNKDGKVIIRKGFMKLSDFMTAIEELKKEIDVVNSAVVMHFRIGTHGGNTPENTHPFPVVSNESLLKKLTAKCDIGMAHNGIIRSVEPRNSISDTMEYDLQILSQLKKLDHNFHKLSVCQKLIEETINGSRMCFLTPDGEITYIGSWDTEKATGIKYSNSGYISFEDDWGGWYSHKNYAKWNIDPEEDFETCEPQIMETIASMICEGYIMTGDGHMYEYDEEDYFLDDFGTVYRYNYDFDVLVKVNDAIAYNNAGIIQRMKEEDSECFYYITDEEECRLYSNWNY